jgi:hypothetical protein
MKDFFKRKTWLTAKGKKWYKKKVIQEKSDTRKKSYKKKVTQKKVIHEKSHTRKKWYMKKVNIKPEQYLFSCESNTFIRATEFAIIW